MPVSESPRAEETLPAVEKTQPVPEESPPEVMSLPDQATPEPASEFQLTLETDPQKDAYAIQSGQELLVDLEESSEAPQVVSGPAGSMTPYEIQAEPAETKAKNKGPIQKRVEREQTNEAAKDRSRLWAEMRHRERQAELSAYIDEIETAQRRGGSFDSALWLKRGLILAVAAAVLGLLGFGGYYVYEFLASGDYKVTATDLWEEYARDTTAANKKYKGAWVQITGTFKTNQEGGKAKQYFEAPGGAKWRIEFFLKQAEVKDLKSGQEVSIRGKLSTRKEPDGALAFGNCTLLRVR
jgi:hypothetical protein